MDGCMYVHIDNIKKKKKIPFFLFFFFFCFLIYTNLIFFYIFQRAASLISHLKQKRKSDMPKG